MKRQLKSLQWERCRATELK